ncbi:MAG: hypothetical protein RH949_25340 [Coleofasciculus sp. A1-SPW-01]|uniref:hypothetical protein n=1 Tax=Coleofasciculus sp. A1-SPW-01 TaxID=3070819 RepID=UPI0032F23BA3
MTYAEYHLFINALEKTGEHDQPNQESTHPFTPKEAETPIQGLTITQKNRFCAWLNWHVRLSGATGSLYPSWR